MSRRVLAITAMCSLCFAYQPPEARRLFEQARRFFEQQHWAEAQAAAAQALAADPRMGDAEILLGLIATAQSRFDEAEAHFVRAVALQPQNSQAHGYLGSTYMQQKRLPDAEHAFRKVLQLSPGNVTANYNLGVIALAQHRPGESLRHFELVSRANGSDIAALIGILESQLMMGRKGDARQTAKQLNGILNDSDARRLEVAALLAQAGEPAEAISMMERARRAFPQSYEVSYNLALACFQAAQYDRAAEVLRPFAGPQGKPEALSLLGAIEEKRGHGVDAERAFLEAARREPAHEDYRFDYGNSLLQQGKLQPAVAAFRAAVSDLPKSWKLRLGLGAACYLAGDYESAVNALLEAVRLKPNSAPAYFLLGEAYDSAQRFQPAIESAFASYLKSAPRDAWAYYHYGAVLYARVQAEGRHEFEAAIANLNEALRLNPNLGEAYVQLGLIALAQGKIEQSVKMLERATALDPQLAAAHYRLALAYQRLGKEARAKEELARFRALKEEEHHRGRVLDALSSIGR